jgi:RNA polymerase sigma-70 factor (ECF subfamily)
VNENRPPQPAGGLFPATRWTLLLAARERPEERRRALDDLIAPRWRALFALARKQGLTPAEAEDAVQSFLARLVEDDLLFRADPARGRLRTFLRAAFHNHLVNLHEHAAAARRGGGRRPVDLDDVEALLASPALSPDAAFDRAWALEMFEGALAALEGELTRGSGGNGLEALRQLFRFGETTPYAELAPQLGMSLPQLKSFVHRAKARFRLILRARVADTLEAAESVDDEVAALLGLLSA